MYRQGTSRRQHGQGCLCHAAQGRGISDSNARSHNVELVETVLTIGTSTGINNSHPEAMTNDNYYDLQGRRMDSLVQKKGVYINDGKKYVR